MVVTWTEVGVPEMTPLLASNERPDGSGGAIEYRVTLPVTVGVSGGMAAPRMNVDGAW
jgi:hypothetical protein